MYSDSILVLGQKERSDIARLLYEQGFTPLVRDNMQKILEKLGHDDITAVVMDTDNASTDIIEFVLNVRDINQDVPIVIVGTEVTANEVQALERQHNIVILNEYSAAIISFVVGTGRANDDPGTEQFKLP